jgi:IS5 family transposase
MKPKKQERSASDDLFRMRLEQMLDQRNALYRLAGKID